MADTANTPRAGEGNPIEAKSINTAGDDRDNREDKPWGPVTADAEKVQELASRVVYLVRGMNRLADDLLPARPGERHREDADNLIVFAEMAEEAATAIRDVGERIERQSRAAGRA